MIDHDRLFKELITVFFWEFIQLFFPQVAAYLEPDSIEFLPQELFTDVTAGEKRKIDIIAKAKLRQQETFFLVHIENQSYYEPNFERRMFRYFARLSEKYNLPVYPIAILSFDYPLKEQPHRYEVVFPDQLVLQFNYKVIQLNRLNWRDFLEHKNPVATALMAKMKIAKEDRKQVKLECLRLLATLSLDPARMQLISGFVDTYLRLNATEEAQLIAEIGQWESENQENVMEIVTSWMEKGIEIGRREGRREGRQEGRREGHRETTKAELNLINAIRRQLQRRIGEITPKLRVQVEYLSGSQLEELGEALLDFTKPSDLANWLQKTTRRSLS